MSNPIDSIAILSDALHERLASGMPLEDAVKILEEEAEDVEALARASIERQEEQERMHQAAAVALDEIYHGKP